MKRIIYLLILLTIVFTGCIDNNYKTIYAEDVNIYFPIKGNEGLDVEIREIQYTDKLERYSKTIEEYLKGPKDKEKFETSFEAKHSVIDVNLEEKKLTINLSAGFNSFSGTMHEAAVVASLVDTLVQFDEIEQVRILVGGKDLVASSGEVYGFMRYVDFYPGSDTREVKLYFGNSQATHVTAETRSINIGGAASDEALFKKVLEELIKGPEDENLYRTIPSEVTVLDVEIIGDIIRVDFSREMHTKHSHGAAGELMTVASLVNTLTELEGIRGVLPTVEGKPLNIEHMYVTEPLMKEDFSEYKL